jgi:PhzF family phenazine biosynthesis protein
MTEREVLRLAAFTRDPAGGNPAGVVIGAHPSDEQMQHIAAEVGYSETAFLAPTGERTYRVRYFSPVAEVDFCGHATIAAGVALGERSGMGTFTFLTNPGEVVVEVADGPAGTVTAALTSVEPTHRQIPLDALTEILDTFGWELDDLDDAIAPAEAFAGAWHLILAVATRETLAAMTYRFDDLRQVMVERDLTTVQVVWREDETTFHARDPFPVGGVVEDPATGAAAAALGGYLRDAGLVRAPFEVVVHQGVDLGRPSRIEVSVPERGGVRVAGTAVADPIDG